MGQTINIKKGKNSMATQDELTQQLNTVSDTLDKVAGETQGLLTEIEKLQELIDSGAAKEELTAAVERVAAHANAIDNMVPDQPAGGSRKK
jgi:archaellum component FlaC